MQPRAPQLSDRQRSFIDRAARALPVDRRQDFERAVLARLVGECNDFAVMTIVNNTLSAIPVED